MQRAAWCLLAVVLLCTPAHAKKDNALAQARADYFKALGIAKKERRSSVDRTIFYRAVNAGNTDKTAKGQRFLAEIAKNSAHPFQRHFTIMMLARMNIAKGEDETDMALRMAKVCVPLSRTIKATVFLTPDWTIEDVDAANAQIENTLRDKLTKLMREGARPVPWLATLGSHRSEIVRRSVAHAIVDVMPKDIQKWLRNRVKREHDPSIHPLWTQAAAVYGLKDLSRHLVSRAGSEDIEIRSASLRALHMLTPDEPIVRATLLKSFDCKDPVIQSLAAWEAGRAGRDALVGYLRDQLKAPRWEVNAQAVRSLEEIGSKKALEVLIKALPDLKRDIVIRAQEAVERMTGERFTDARAWWKWWAAHQSFDPRKSRVAPPPVEVSRHVDRFPPEGQRFVVAAFLDGTTDDEPVTKTRAKLFEELCGGLDEEAAMAVWCAGWWSVQGDLVSRTLLPQMAPKLPAPSYPGYRRSTVKVPTPPARVIPYFDASRFALRTIHKELPAVLKGTFGNERERPWRELEEVLATAEVESIYLFATKDLPELPAAQTEALRARLRWAALGRPLRLRLAFVGKQPPVQLVQLMKEFGGTWTVRKPPPPSLPSLPPPPPKDGKAKQDGG